MPKSIFSDRYKAFLAVLVDARRSAALTQVELAVRLGKPQSFVSKVETGERRLDFVEFVDWARAVGMNELDLAALILGNAAFQNI